MKGDRLASAACVEQGHLNHTFRGFLARRLIFVLLPMAGAHGMADRYSQVLSC